MIKLYISPNNLSKYSDVVFAETVSFEDFDKLATNNKVVVYKSESSQQKTITYKLNKFTLKENDLIFCHTEFVDELFMLLNKVKELNNIKLITHQSDKALTMKQILKNQNAFQNGFH